MTTEYFENLKPDYVQEVPTPNEALRRLLYMFKVAINGKACVLKNSDADTTIAISPEFISEFGWTFEEFAALDPADFFDNESLVIATIHAENKLAAPYMAKCKNKNGDKNWYKVQGLNVEVDGINWRMVVFEGI